MPKVIVLDTGVLGLITNPKARQETQDCVAWLRDHLMQNATVIVPEIADYEVRRELLRGNKTRGLTRLDAFVATMEYDPITTPVMRQAAHLWAQARQKGKPTASNDALDGDVVLCAQAQLLAKRPQYVGDNLVIATTNVKHLTLFVAAEEWRNIT